MIYAIGDLHLPGGMEKPMDVFGKHWEDHFSRIREDWTARVRETDVVLIPGDISWAMNLAPALEDLRSIDSLPGRKILLRGNHDYWWNSIGRLREALPPTIRAVQNDALETDGTVFCGSRGWTWDDIPENRRIYERELLRMELSLKKAKTLGGERLVVMTHFPPLNEAHEDTPMSELIASYAPSDVVYGHLHGASLKNAFNGERAGIRYHCVSCDGLGFRLKEIP